MFSFICLNNQQIIIMLVKNVLSIYLKIKQNCCFCFYNKQQQQNSRDVYQQLTQITKGSPLKYQNQIKMMPEMKQKTASTKHQKISSQMALANKIRSNSKINQSEGSVREQQFQSMQSFSLESNKDTFQRKSFNIYKSRRKIISFHQFQQCLAFIPLRQDQYSSYNTPQPNVIQSQIQKIKDWMKQQYFNSKILTNFKLSNSTKLRMQGINMLNMIINKLDDYKLFYIQDKSNLSLNRYCNKTRTLICNYTQHSLLQQSIHNSPQYKSYCKIYCNTQNIMKILKWLNSFQTLSILHHFYNLTIISAEDANIHDFTIVQVQQYDKKLKGKSIYQLCKQIQEVQFLKEEGHFVVQGDYTLDEGDQHFQRICKIYVSKKGYIQIYTQSSQNITLDEDDYFQQKWERLNQYLSNLQFLCKNINQLMQ